MRQADTLTKEYSELYFQDSVQKFPESEKLRQQYSFVLPV